jgi:hypothetical protein
MALFKEESRGFTQSEPLPNYLEREIGLQIPSYPTENTPRSNPI